ncbi:hypothetical protein [Sedimenticola thiotaurini]|uniref:hypothetical protein n=1 Tax=Sedimenticola thiotaurini TaxID=1543721 RepID=UPI001900937C|nr:hypothetical protein [Sedimenticola thiotaurini]
MRKKSEQEKNRDFRFAFKCAQSFFELSKPFLEEVGSDLNGGVLVAAQDPGALVSAATNLSLSLELFIKSLRVGLGLSVPDTHNFWALYKSLPNNVKQIIESKYNQKVSNTPKEKLFKLNVAYEHDSTGDGPKAPVFPNQQGLSTEVKPLLKRSSNAFVTWRYIYESVKPGERYFFITLEYSHLIILLETIKEYIRENDPKNKKP